MSDFEHDIDDELLALAGDSEGRRKKSKQSSSRKRKNAHSDSDRDIKSEEEDESDNVSDPYPFEGKYVDEEDKQRLLEMPEIRREEILAERIEEKQRLQEKQVLAQMVKQQRSGGGGGGTFDADDDSVAKAAKRQHTARGATKEKTRKLDELKAKRKAKDESRKRAKLSPNASRRSSSPQDMDISSDEDSEDGQITKSDQEEERERRLLGLTSKKEAAEDNSPATVEDFNRCRLTRDLVAKWCMAPWFNKYVQDAWVRYLIGNREGEAVYRMCCIQGVSNESTKPYKVNERTVNQMVDLQHGKSVKAFNMDRISNAPFSQSEFDRLSHTCTKEKVKLPTKKELQTKSEEMRKLQTQPMTDSDITAMLKKKKEMSATQSNSDLVLEKQGLHQARSLALKRQDYKEATELEEKISELEIRIHGSSNGGSPKKAADDKDEILRRVNERNRKANLDAVRRAEAAASEQKRREREAAAKAAAQGGAAAAAAVVAKFDPSARLKTMPRLFNAATPGTRPGTPASASGTPAPPSAMVNASDSSVRPLPTANTTMAFEKKLLDDIDIDLGDF